MYSFREVNTPNRRGFVIAGLASLALLGSQQRSQALNNRQILRHIVAANFDGLETNLIVQQNINDIANHMCGYPSNILIHLDREWGVFDSANAGHIRVCPVCYLLLINAVDGVVHPSSHLFPKRKLDFIVHYDGRQFATTITDCAYLHELYANGQTGSRLGLVLVEENGQYYVIDKYNNTVNHDYVS